MRRRTRRLFDLVVVSALVGLIAACGPLGEGEHNYNMPPDDDDPWVLVDLRHTEIQNPVDYRLHRDQFDYQGTYGFYRLFEHLQTWGYPWEPTDEKLSEPRLEPYDILFINLVHDRMPDFTPDEIEAIKNFVHDGGGLFVIGDHTNVYRHAERVNPFLEPMGLRMMYHTVADHPPFNSISGLGWIMSFDFSDHPINEDVEMISFKTGGPIEADDPNDHLAFTSEDGFADYWDEENESGYYGTWSQGDDHQLEPSGPLSIASATEYGDGRAVLVGDQNIFGDAWLHVGDNFEFALNAFDWLVGNEDAEQPLRDRPPKGHDIAFESDVNFYQTVRNDGPGHGYYYAFIESNRNEQVTARATTGLDTDNTDTLVFLSSDIEFDEPELDDRTYSEAELAQALDFVEDGGRAVVSFEPVAIPEPTVQLLETLTDDFALEIGDGTWEPADGPIGDASARDDDAEPPPQADEIPGFHDIDAPELDVGDIGLGALEPWEFPDDEDYRENGADYTEDDFDFYLYDVRATGGEPLVEADAGDDRVTVAQRHSVGDGEVIVVVQDGFWRNRTLGSDELLEPRSFFRSDIVDFHHAFLDYLRR